MYNTLNLLKIVGTPFDSQRQDKIIENIKFDLLELSKKNRMTLLYLESLNKIDQLNGLKYLYEDMNKKSWETYFAMSRASGILDQHDVPHAIFKTVRPYPATTVDIDIVIYDSDVYFDKSLNYMIKEGYRKIGFGPKSETIMDPFCDVSVDLYYDISVSNIIYLDKNNFESCIINKTLPNKDIVKTYSPQADLICLIAHSIIKEQMFTLSEYYSTLFFLDEMSKKDIDIFIEMIYQNNIVNAASAHIWSSAILHKKSHGFLPIKINKILKELPQNAIEINKIMMTYETPYKFHPITIMKSFIEKTLKDNTSRGSVGKQIVSFMNPYFTKQFIVDFINHVTRSNY